MILTYAPDIALKEEQIACLSDGLSGALAQFYPAYRNDGGAVFGLFYVS
jgi:hypothetical protein